MKVCAVSPLNVKSLKEQVYDYLRQQIHLQVLRPGMAVNLERTSAELGISRTPLRDALIQLEMEGFVTIKARRGIYVNGLTLDEIGEFYQVIGALEQSALMMAGSDLDVELVREMRQLNGEMKKSLERDQFDLFYSLNLSFHNLYLNRCNNRHLIRIVENLKKRLYDFPSQERWLKEWELSSVAEHDRMVDYLERGDISAAARYIHDVHWGFECQRPFIEKYYFPVKTETG